MGRDRVCGSDKTPSVGLTPGAVPITARGLAGFGASEVVQRLVTNLAVWAERLSTGSAKRASLMRPPILKCPYCHAVITGRYTAGQPLVCESCHRRLMIAPWHLRITSLGGTVLTIFLCFILGIRGVRLLMAIVVLWFPISLIWTLLLNRLIPPRLVECKAKNDPGPRGSGSGLCIR